MIQKHRNEQILEATCLFIANTLSRTAIQLDSSPTSKWRTVLEQGLRHRTVEVQEAAAIAMRNLSKLVDCSSDVQR
jgi:hypothetical protein